MLEGMRNARFNYHVDATGRETWAWIDGEGQACTLRMEALGATCICQGDEGRPVVYDPEAARWYAAILQRWTRDGNLSPWRVLVFGSRDWDQPDLIRAELQKIPPASVVIHGDCGQDENGKFLWGEPDERAVKGADKLAGKIARELGHTVEVYTPVGKWPAAGPRRNARMLAEGRPDRALGFVPDLKTSHGSRNMYEQCLAAGLKPKIITGLEPAAVNRASNGSNESD